MALHSLIQTLDGLLETLLSFIAVMADGHGLSKRNTSKMFYLDVWALLYGRAWAVGSQGYCSLYNQLWKELVKVFAACEMNF